MEMFCKRPFHLWEREKRAFLPAIEKPLTSIAQKWLQSLRLMVPFKIPIGSSALKVHQHRHKKELPQKCRSSFLICYSFTNLLTPGLPALHQRSPGQRANGFLFNCIISYISENRNPDQRSYLIKIL